MCQELVGELGFQAVYDPLGFMVIGYVEGGAGWLVAQASAERERQEREIEREEREREKVREYSAAVPLGDADATSAAPSSSAASAPVTSSTEAPLRPDRSQERERAVEQGEGERVWEGGRESFRNGKIELGHVVVGIDGIPLRSKLPCQLKELLRGGAFQRAALEVAPAELPPTPSPLQEGGGCQAGSSGPTNSANTLPAARATRGKNWRCDMVRSSRLNVCVCVCVCNHKIQRSQEFARAVKKSYLWRTQPTHEPHATHQTTQPTQPIMYIYIYIHIYI
jgi:hypothetical protein